MCPSEYIMVTSIAANDSKLVLGSGADSAHKYLKQWKINVNIETLDYYFIFFYKKQKQNLDFC